MTKINHCWQLKQRKLMNFIPILFLVL
uniref:Uncharacterized protein n=1 Tax=Anguilla anguilla TaxID=7936 RepID=A0A0E9XV26_ANGAN